MRIALRFVGHCLRNGVPGILENPQTSRVSHTAEVQRFLAAGARIVVLDQCRFGTKWRKSTSLLCCNLDSVDMASLERRCSGKHGICSSTGKPHIQLEGRGHMTAKAAAYPTRLCTAMVNALTSNLRMQVAGKLYDKM